MTDNQYKEMCSTPQVEAPQTDTAKKHIMFYWGQYDCVCNICKDERAEYERGLSDGQQNPLDGEGHSKEG